MWEIRRAHVYQKGKVSYSGRKEEEGEDILSSSAEVGFLRNEKKFFTFPSLSREKRKVTNHIYNGGEGRKGEVLLP